MSRVKQILESLKQQRKERPCGNCGKPLNTTNLTAKYCSESCRVAGWTRSTKKVLHIRNPQPTASGKIMVSIDDLPWKSRVRAGKLAPKFGEMCLCCGKLQLTKSEIPGKRGYCSEVCELKAKAVDTYFLTGKESVTRIPRSYCLAGGQETLKKIAQAQRILYSKLLCDFCERRTLLKDCGQKPRDTAEQQPTTWIGSAKPQHLFCSETCRFHFYTCTSGSRYAPEPINKPMVITDPLVAKLVNHALGQPNPLQVRAVNTKPRAQFNLPPLPVRRATSGAGTMLHRAEDFASLPHKFKRTHKLMPIGTRKRVRATSV